jgi:Na+(H+)/acetate symporter ActP
LPARGKRPDHVAPGTAYTFIAVPAAMFGAGAVQGWFAVSYTIIVFPIALIFLPRLWSIARAHNYVTPADFIRGRYGSRGLSLAIAFTGILALMPYIALQLVGIQAVLTVMGVGTSSTNSFIKDLPLFIAFLVLAIFTYVSGLRAPALIAFVKDTLVYLMIIVAVFYIPTRIGGLGAHLRGRPDAHGRDQPGHAQANRHIHPPDGQQPAGLLHPGPRLRAGADGLPARGHRRAVHQAVRCCSRSPCPRRSPSTCSYSAASGSCRRSRRWCSACSPAGSTDGPCWRDGWPA